MLTPGRMLTLLALLGAEEVVLDERKILGLPGNLGRGEVIVPLICRKQCPRDHLYHVHIDSITQCFEGTRRCLGKVGKFAHAL